MFETNFKSGFVSGTCIMLKWHLHNSLHFEYFFSLQLDASFDPVEQLLTDVMAFYENPSLDSNRQVTGISRSVINLASVERWNLRASQLLSNLVATQVVDVFCNFCLFLHSPFPRGNWMTHSEISRRLNSSFAIFGLTAPSALATTDSLFSSTS